MSEWTFCNWNTRKRSGSMAQAIDYGIDTFDPDILLLQECYAPENELTPEQLEAWEGHLLWTPKANQNPPNGSAILSRRAPLTPLAFPEFEGWITLAAIDGPDGQEVAVASLHTPTTPHVLESYNVGVCIEWMQEVAIPALMERTLDFANLIIAGDFNASTLYRKIDAQFMDWMDAQGFVNATKQFHDTELRSYRRAGTKQIYQIDYLFIRGPLHEALSSSDIIENEEVIALSDHNPQITTFSFS